MKKQDGLFRAYIDENDSRPIVQSNFQTPKLVEDEINEHIKQMRSGIIENSNSS